MPTAHPNIVLLLQQQLSKSSWPGEDHNILHTSTKKSEVFARSSASTAEVSALQKPPANLSSRLLTWLDPHIDQSFDVLRGEKLCLRIDCGCFNVYFFQGTIYSILLRPIYFLIELENIL